MLIYTLTCTLTHIHTNRCCTATEDVPRSCTYPLTQFQEPSRNDLCPNPPRLSFEDAFNFTTRRLDSDLVYVDEYLIEKAEDLGSEIYVRRLLGGFVITNHEPNYGSCGVDNLEESLDEAFTQCREIRGSEYYTFNTSAEEFSWLNTVENCPNISDTSNGNGSGLNADSLVDGTGVDLFRYLVCESNATISNYSSLPIYTPVQTPRSKGTAEATIYYNNNVCLFYVEFMYIHVYTV